MSTIHTDGYPSYNQINWNYLKINIVKKKHKSNNGNLKRTFKNSNFIEGLQSELKYIQKHIYSTVSGNTNLKDFLYESIWIRSYLKIRVQERLDFVNKFFKKLNYYDLNPF